MNARTRSLTYDYCKNEKRKERKMGVEAIAECVLNCTDGTNYTVVAVDGGLPVVDV